jgi:mono/diheme cytochrome c family protein
MLMAIGAVALGAVAAPAQEASVDAGRTEYLSACAGCHGRDAKGDGPMADLLSIETPDLTRMAERAGGAFPWGPTIRIIDGREDVRAHGSDMPVWGARYMASALADAPATETPEIPVLETKGRILSLVMYLESIQQ